MCVSDFSGTYFLEGLLFLVVEERVVFGILRRIYYSYFFHFSFINLKHLFVFNKSRAVYIFVFTTFLLCFFSLMQASIDTTEVDRGPIVDNKIEIALFYIFFVVVFSFFFINIFVALIILTFQEQGEKDQGDCELDRNQVRRMRDKRDCVTASMCDSVFVISRPCKQYLNVHLLFMEYYGKIKC